MQEVVGWDVLARRVDPADPHALVLCDRVGLAAVACVEAEPDDTETPPAESPELVEHARRLAAAGGSREDPVPREVIVGLVDIAAGPERSGDDERDAVARSSN